MREVTLALEIRNQLLRDLVEDYSTLATTDLQGNTRIWGDQLQHVFELILLEPDGADIQQQIAAMQSLGYGEPQRRAIQYHHEREYLRLEWHWPQVTEQHWSWLVLQWPRHTGVLDL